MKRSRSGSELPLATSESSCTRLRNTTSDDCDRVESDQIARDGFGPQRLALARLVVLHHRARRRQNVLRRAVILLQPNDLGLGEVVLEVQDVADVGAAPAINRLVLVADDAHILVL